MGPINQALATRGETALFVTVSKWKDSDKGGKEGCNKSW